MELPFPRRHCIVCGKKFLPHHQNQTLCSDECRKNRRKVYRETLAQKDYPRNWRKQQKLKILSVLGNKCILCGRSQSILFHDKSFINHYHTDGYVLAHINDFVVLCKRCHTMVHFLNRIFGLSWNEILSLKKKQH